MVERAYGRGRRGARSDAMEDAQGGGRADTLGKARTGVEACDGWGPGATWSGAEAGASGRGPERHESVATVVQAEGRPTGGVRRRK